MATRNMFTFTHALSELVLLVHRRRLADAPETPALLTDAALARIPALSEGPWREACAAWVVKYGDFLHEEGTLYSSTLQGIRMRNEGTAHERDAADALGLPLQPRVATRAPSVPARRAKPAR